MLLLGFGHSGRIGSAAESLRTRGEACKAGWFTRVPAAASNGRWQAFKVMRSEWSAVMLLGFTHSGRIGSGAELLRCECTRGEAYKAGQSTQATAATSNGRWHGSGVTRTAGSAAMLLCAHPACSCRVEVGRYGREVAASGEVAPLAASGALAAAAENGSRSVAALLMQPERVQMEVGHPGWSLHGEDGGRVGAALCTPHE